MKSCRGILILEGLQPMTENTEPSSPSHPAPDPEILKSTIRAMKQSEQRANNVPALIKALLCTGTCLLISITGNAIQYWHSTNVEREYFATDNGRLVRLAPTSQPAWSQNDAMAFGSRALATAFNRILCTIVHRSPPCLRVFLTKVLSDM